MNNYLLILVVALVSISCKTRSISNSDYGGNWGYRGELSELEVLGVDVNKKISEEDIKAEIEAVTGRIVAAVAKVTGAVLRG